LASNYDIVLEGTLRFLRVFLEITLKLFNSVFNQFVLPRLAGVHFFVSGQYESFPLNNYLHSLFSGFYLKETKSKCLHYLENGVIRYPAGRGCFGVPCPPALTCNFVGSIFFGWMIVVSSPFHFGNQGRWANSFHRLVFDPVTWPQRN